MLNGKSTSEKLILWFYLCVPSKTWAHNQIQSKKKKEIWCVVGEELIFIGTEFSQETNIQRLELIKFLQKLMLELFILLLYIYNNPNPNPKP